MCGVGSASTLRRMVLGGYFPEPVRLGKRSIGWKTKDVTDWLENLKPREENATKTLESRLNPASHHNDDLGA